MRPCAQEELCRYTSSVSILRRRFQRMTTTFWVVLSLLFSQLALANYACPGQADVEAMAEMMAAGMPCDGVDQRQPALCHEHSAGAPQTVEVGKVPTPSLPMIVQVLAVPLVIDAGDASAARTSDQPEPRPPPDPVFLSTLRLRV